MDGERFHELKDAYVLGALSEDERADFERYLSAHPEHQAEIDDLGSIAGLLAFSPPEHEPSPALHSKLMEVVRAEATTPSTSEPRRVSPRRGWYSGAPGIALAAAAVILVGLLSWNLLLQGQVQDLRGKVEQAQAGPRTPASQARTISFAGSWANKGVQAKLTAMGHNKMVLVAENMPQVPKGHTCQIWVIKNGTPEPGGLFQPGGRMTAAPVTRPLKGADAVAITVEPAGGSAKPTTKPVLTSKL